MFSKKTIFISPLDWGLGHATRCVPLIQSLSKHNTIIIGVTNLNRDFFNAQFPSLQKVNLPSYGIQYSKRLPAWLKILTQAPKIKSVIKAENKLLDQLVNDYHLNVVISDNRFGLHHKSVHSIFMTHQLTLKAPFFSGLANRINRNFIHHFDEVWVPDYEEEARRLSGQLSESRQIKIPVKYIGPLSALSDVEAKPSPEKKVDYLLLLSGTEPQRTALEKILLEKYKDDRRKITLVRGCNFPLSSIPENINVIDFACGAELKELILNADVIICRSGYSTLMDLHLLEKKKLMLIPTPGQTEQSYLAEHWKKKCGSKVIPQNKLTVAIL